VPIDFFSLHVHARRQTLSADAADRKDFENHDEALLSGKMGSDRGK
jgi:hypothetical protein